MIIPNLRPQQAKGVTPKHSTEANSDIGFSLKEVYVNNIAIPEQQIMAEAQNHPAASPGRALRAAAEALVIKELLWQEAKKLNLSSPSEKDKEGRLETKSDAAIRILIDQEVTIPTATPDVCRLYYEKHPEKFNTPTIYEARHILIAAPESDKARRHKAQALAVEICKILNEKPELFSSLAKEHSECSSRDQGGNLGQLSPGSTVTEFETALAEMHEGEISQVPVASRFGFHVIALDRSIEGKSLPFDMVSERIAGWLEASAWSKAVSQYISILVGRAEIRGITLKGTKSPLVQ